MCVFLFYYRFGPLVRYWCMRMEAKNAYTKKAACRGNFKNVALSFAHRHQRLLAYHLSNSDMMSVDIQSGPGIYTYMYIVPYTCDVTVVTLAQGRSVQLEKASANVVNAIKTVMPDVSLSDYIHK